MSQFQCNLPSPHHQNADVKIDGSYRPVPSYQSPRSSVMEARFYVPIIGILASVVLCIQGQGQGGVRIAQCEINNSPNQQTFRLGRCRIGTLVVHRGHNRWLVWLANILKTVHWIRSFQSRIPPLLTMFKCQSF